jgi:hypothetical protein
MVPSLEERFRQLSTSNKLKPEFDHEAGGSLASELKASVKGGYLLSARY